MTHDDALLRALSGLDEPIDPAPAFAERLYRLARAEFEHRPRPVTSSAEQRPPAPVRIGRRQDGRWMQIAAVAVLLVSMIGGIARVSTGGDPTPTIQAPTGSQAGELIGRSAAGDGQLPGPAPDADQYKQLWAMEADTTRSPTHGAAVYGSYVYRIPEVGDEQRLGDLKVLDLYTGEEAWRQQVDVSVTAEVTSRGVIAGLPTGNDTFHLALLDLRTGVPVWTWWGKTFASLETPHVAALLVADETVFFSVSDGSIYGLELVSGEFRFGRSAPRLPPLGISNPLCATPDQCLLRSNTDISMVYGNGTLYVSDLGASSVFAMSGQSGEELWSVSTADRPGSTNISYASMIAVDEGLIVAFQDTEASDFTAVVYWGLWAANDGQEVWKGTLSLGDQRMVANGNSLFVLFNDPEQGIGICCDIAEVEIATGTVMRTRGSIARISLEGYLSDKDTLIVRTLEPGENIIGIDRELRTLNWRLALEPHGCYIPVFPINANGTMVCLSSVGTVAAYQPIGPPQATPEGTPEAASDEAAVAPWSAAVDGTSPGLAPASGEYRLLWRGQPSGFGFVTPYRGKIFAVVSRMSETSAQGVVAYDAATGAELWYQPVSASFNFAVTSAGVVVGVPDSFGTGASPAADASIWDFRVVLLNLETGQPIWRSAGTYQLPGASALIFVQIADGAALFVDRHLALVAIDLATGQERWRHESSKPPAPECAEPASQPLCSPGVLAAAGDTVYFDNPATGQIVAVSLRTGDEIWSGDDPLGPIAADASTGLPSSRPLILTAVDQGVLVNTWSPMAGGAGTFGLWSAVDGSPVWSWSESKGVQSFVVAGDSLIVMTRDLADNNLQLERVDLATGQVLETLVQLSGEYVSLRYLPADQMLRVGTWAGDQGSFWLDLDTLEVSQRGPTTEQCTILSFPVLPNGNVACSTSVGLTVYAPSPSSGTPVAAPSGKSILPPVGNGERLITTVPDVVLRAAPGEGSTAQLTFPATGSAVEFVGQVGIDAEANVWYRVRSIETALVGYIRADQLAPEQ
jgi:outer membrane protein assembly factor BamB